MTNPSFILLRSLHTRGLMMQHIGKVLAYIQSPGHGQVLSDHDNDGFSDPCFRAYAMKIRTR